MLNSMLIIIIYIMKFYLVPYRGRHWLYPLFDNYYETAHVLCSAMQHAFKFDMAMFMLVCA